MQIEDHFLLMKLFDIYGNLLSQKQKSVMDMFLNLDIGESEIADELGESRQSIHDAITKAKKQLFSFEEKCGELSRREKISERLGALKTKMPEMNSAQIVSEIDDIISLL